MINQASIFIDDFDGDLTLGSGSWQGKTGFHVFRDLGRGAMNRYSSFGATLERGNWLSFFSTRQPIRRHSCRTWLRILLRGFQLSTVHLVACYHGIEGATPSFVHLSRIFQVLMDEPFNKSSIRPQGIQVPSPSVIYS